MKKLLLTLVIISFCGAAQANPLDITDTLNKLDLKQGIVYNFNDSEVDHISTAEIVNKWGASLEAGYGDAGKLVGVLSYKLLDAKDYINIPILKELTFKPGVFVGLDEIDKETKVSWGVSLTLLSVQF